MAHLAPAWPDQVLCKENKRRALNEQQRKWMQQREQALAHSKVPAAEQEEVGDDDKSLDEINDFLADVGAALADGPSSHGEYEEANAMLRELHLCRRGLPATHALPAEAPPHPPPATKESTAQRSSQIPSHRRSAAQRAAAQRLAAPKPSAVWCDERPSRRASPAPLIGSEDFYKHKQEGIRRYREAYDGHVNAHFDALASGHSAAMALPPTVTGSGNSVLALAHENASRHVRRIRK